MDSSVTSRFLFDLINEFEVLSSSGKANSWTDNDLELFCNKYKTASIQRDNALFRYIESSHNPFRCHLPFSKWTVSVAFTVVWYYDELILTDPVIDAINNPLPDKENQKNRLQNLLRFIYDFRESVHGGYILFAGDHIVPNKTNQFLSASEKMVNDKDVLVWFERSTLLGQKPSPINSNPADNLIQLNSQYDGMWGDYSNMGMYIPPHVFNSGKLSNGVMYDFSTPFSRLTKEELIKYGKQDIIDGLKKEYARDIAVVLETLTNAQRLNAPVLFYRDVDCEVAKRYSIENPSISNKLVANTSVYDYSLPFMEGVPSERLFEIRTQAPDAFIEFRELLSKVVYETMKATDDPREIKYRIDKEVKAYQRKLGIEMESAKRKWNFHGVAAPIILGLGSLHLYSSGIDYSSLLGTMIGGGGLIKSLTTWADVKSDRRKAEVNPVYFLWKVNQEKNM